ATFVRGNGLSVFDFRDKFSKGWGSAYQVLRGTFDKLLADEVQRQGAVVHYRRETTGVQFNADGARLTVKTPDGAFEEYEGRFVLDASGSARVLPRLLGLLRPSTFPVRQAIFTHVQDGIPSASDFDREKILVTVHPKRKDVWYWLIPFPRGRSSVGVVAPSDFLAPFEGDLDAGLKEVQFQASGLKSLLKNAVWDTPAKQMKGYAADVSTLHGPNFALLGNAGEFLDPVFSSGVTIAFKSASLAAGLLDRRFRGESPDWEIKYSAVLRRGVDCFRAYVEAWYDGTFQDIIFYEDKEPTIKRMICSILAGYAWDLSNPHVADPRRLKSLAAICKLD
ncbi:MAG: NAD(P)/FAD-dependent oxidoreductase, partial [bacterium]